MNPGRGSPRAARWSFRGWRVWWGIEPGSGGWG
jgi:hypothetical protein